MCTVRDIEEAIREHCQSQCEMCGANPVKVYMHHVKRLKDLNADNEFDELMLLKRRKSLALCPKCYEEAKTKSLKL